MSALSPRSDCTKITRDRAGIAGDVDGRVWIDAVRPIRLYRASVGAHGGGIRRFDGDTDRARCFDTCRVLPVTMTSFAEIAFLSAVMKPSKPFKELVTVAVCVAWMAMPPAASAELCRSWPVTLTLAALMPMPSVSVPWIVLWFTTLSVEVPSVGEDTKTPPVMKLLFVMSALSTESDASYTTGDYAGIAGDVDGRGLDAEDGRR